MERRDRQSLNLNHHTHPGSSTGISGQSNDWWLRISLKAQQKDAVFHNLLTHVNAKYLKEAFRATDGSKALGADKVSKKDYGKNLEENLRLLENKIHRGTYRPKPKREVLIPKANGKTRPIAIACFKDKLVGHVAAKILSAIYEPLFIRNSFGFRPNKSADHAIKAIYYSLKNDSRQNVVEIDFSSFFNTIPHKKLIEVLGKRISDDRFKGFIGRFSSYNNVIVRYADDAVFFFKKEDDAKNFMQQLNVRVKEYGLSLNEEKTHIVNFKKSEQRSFNFLGFTFYWGKSGKHKRQVKVKTQKEKLMRSIQEFEAWIKRNRSKMTTSEIWSMAKLKLQGHYNYFGFWTNSGKLNHLYFEAIKSLFKWLNRRSQLVSYKVDEFKEKLKQQPLPRPLPLLQMKQLGPSLYAN
jgi:RNA-directed DNA polymerase